jgi:hypothetical protein
MSDARLALASRHNPHLVLGPIGPTSSILSQRCLQVVGTQLRGIKDVGEYGSSTQILRKLFEQLAILGLDF